MPVRIDEISTIIEPVSDDSRSTGETSTGEPMAFEVQLEALRPLVRALVAEEMERWLRTRGDQR